jgi:hypothetical protein
MGLAMGLEMKLTCELRVTDCLGHRWATVLRVIHNH